MRWYKYGSTMLCNNLDVVDNAIRLGRSPQDIISAMASVGRSNNFGILYIMHQYIEMLTEEEGVRGRCR